MSGFRLRTGLSSDTNRNGEGSLTLVSAELAADRCFDILNRHPSGLFSDFDGTLSAIAVTPDAARPFPGATEAIDRLNTLVDHLSIITGRAASDALTMIGLADVRAIGNHGLEKIDNGVHSVHPVGTAAQASIALAMTEISAGINAVIDSTGMVFENKVYSASIHFRNTPAPELIDEHLAPLARRIASEHDLRITGGKMMYELRPRTIVSKGTALSDLIEEFSLAGAIFIGDDITDVDGFEVLRKVGQDGQTATLAIGVLSEETPASVIEQSDIVLSGVEETVLMLTLLADKLESQS